jgi:hypothetical protein
VTTCRGARMVGLMRAGVHMVLLLFVLISVASTPFQYWVLSITVLFFSLFVVHCRRVAGDHCTVHESWWSPAQGVLHKDQINSLCHFCLDPMWPDQPSDWCHGRMSCGRWGHPWCRMVCWDCGTAMCQQCSMTHDCDFPDPP